MNPENESPTNDRREGSQREDNNGTRPGGTNDGFKPRFSRDTTDSRSNDRPAFNRDDKRSDDRPRFNRDDRDNDRPAFNRDNQRSNDRPRSDRPAFNRDDRRSDDRPRPAFNRDDNRTSDRPRDDRPRFDRNDESKTRFNRDDKRTGDRPSYNRDDNRTGDRPSYNRDDKRSDSSRPVNRDDNRTGDRPTSDRPRFERNSDESRPRFNRDDRPRDDRPGNDRPRFERNDRPAFNRDERRSDGPPTDKPTGDRPVSNRDDKRSDDRPRFNRDENRTGDRPTGDRPRFERNNDESRPRFNRDNNRSTDRPAFNRDDRRGDSPRPPFNRDENRNSDRPRFERNNDESRPRFNRDDRPTGDRPRFERNNDESRPRFSRDEERKHDRPAFNRPDRESASKARFDRRSENNDNDRAPRSERGSDRNDSTPRRTGRYENAPNYNLGAMRDGLPAKNRAAFNKATGSSRDAEAGVLRLNRYIANAGVCSRREADELIAKGDVSVNGQVITEMGHKVKQGDIVKYANKVLNPERIVYLLLNKPKGYITTTDDPKERQTVMDLIEEAGNFRLYPVGRLDRNTTGLLLMTNDGELAEKLTHPSNNIKKIYQVELDKPITEQHFQAIRDGIELEDGLIKPDDLGIVTPDAQVVGIEIHSGRNRIVRRIFEHLGYEVTKLDRTTYAGLTKKDLPRGKWRFLDPKEVVKLKYFNN